jgi:hypothetical protein
MAVAFRMRGIKSPRWRVGLVLLAALLFLSPCLAQPSDPNRVPTYYSHDAGFSIPFQTEASTRIRRVQMYVSEDLGRTWQLTAEAQPGERSFNFQSRHDGWYWFTVRTIDNEDKAYPASMDLAQPKLKVCVDTQRPVVQLRAGSVQGSNAAVEWDVRDDNLDLSSLRLDYRLPNGAWQALTVQQTATGQRGWNPATNAALEVRLQVRDYAGNLGEATIPVTPGAAPAAVPGPAADPAAGSSVRIVNNKRININYKLEEVGKSGIAVIELWWTRDGHSWTKYNERANPEPGAPYTLEVSDEGLYGFTLVARNKAGFGESPPGVGDAPQIWVEVDLTKPVVRLLGVDVGRTGADKGNLTITYSAADKNLERRPITISYAEKPDGTWTPIARNEENIGRYVWRMPDDVPYQFYVRVEAADRAGNSGTADSTAPVIVDLSKPRVKVIDVGPGSK